MINPDEYYYLKQLAQTELKNKSGWLVFPPAGYSGSLADEIVRLFLEDESIHTAIGPDGNPEFHNYVLKVPGNRDNALEVYQSLVYAAHAGNSFAYQYLDFHNYNSSKAVICTFRTLEMHQKELNLTVDKVFKYVYSRKDILKSIAQYPLYLGRSVEFYRLTVSGAIHTAEQYRNTRKVEFISMVKPGSEFRNWLWLNSIRVVTLRLLTGVVGMSAPWAAALAIVVMTIIEFRNSPADINGAVLERSVGVATSIATKSVIRTMFRQTTGVAGVLIGAINLVGGGVISGIARHIVHSTVSDKKDK